MKEGMKFQPQVDPVTGRFIETELEESVRDSIYLILQTQRSERTTRPEFGSNMLSYTFADTAPAVLYMMTHHLEDAILTQEPRITDIDIQIQKDEREGCLFIHLSYSLAEGDEDEMTVPFYVNADKERERNYDRVY